MKFKWFIILTVCGMAFQACKTNNQTQCMPVPGIAPVVSVNVRIVDKTTGADLFLSPSSPYKFSDLQVTGSLSASGSPVFVDSVKKDGRYIIIIATQSQAYYLKLAALPADTINLTVSDETHPCYDVKSVGAITLDGTPVCSPCSAGQVVTIKK